MDHTLKSGARLFVSCAPFEDGNRLRKAVMRTLMGVKYDGDVLGHEAIMALSVSEEVEACFWACAARSSYQHVKVTRGLFDEAKLGPQAQSDYLEIFARVLEAHLRPFFQNASSASPTAAPTPA